MAINSQRVDESVTKSPTTVKASPKAGTLVSPERKEANYARRYWKMDVNKDGVVTDAERATAFDWMLTNRERFRNRVDRDKNGSVSDVERKAALQRFRVRPPRGGRLDGAKTPSP